MGEVRATVLFVHGLESGPQGRKARALAEAGFTVVAAQMPWGRAAVLAAPVVIALGLAALGAVIASGVAFGGVGAGIAVVLVLAAFPVARAAVVGSSFGGAVVVGLLAEGASLGPTLLMCPAFGLVAERAWMPRPVALVGQERVVVVHGLRDETVPVAHSQALVAGSSARLVLVDDDHRLSASATAENLAGWLALVGVAPG